ncbi:MAG: ORF6N domain-containing protein [Candidatus Omnitrophica bacterium]|nr:ORF6N domain-containing protein [Candidatus Omnitrophota bacterium]
MAGDLVDPTLIERRIFTVRGYKVMLDSDLAQLYGVSTSALIQAVKRNQKRFPADFTYQLTRKELAILRSQFVTSSWGGRRYLPYVFTEHGALMAASVLNSKRAVAVSIYVIRAFIRLRETFLDNQILQFRLKEIEDLLLEHDATLEGVLEKLRLLFLSKKPGAIDFQSENGNS